MNTNVTTESKRRQQVKDEGRKVKDKGRKGISKDAGVKKNIGDFNIINGSLKIFGAFFFAFTSRPSTKKRKVRANHQALEEPKCPLH